MRNSLIILSSTAPWTDLPHLTRGGFTFQLIEDHYLGDEGIEIAHVSQTGNFGDLLKILVMYVE